MWQWNPGPDNGFMVGQRRNSYLRLRDRAIDQSYCWWRNALTQQYRCLSAAAGSTCIWMPANFMRTAIATGMERCREDFGCGWRIRKRNGRAAVMVMHETCRCVQGRTFLWRKNEVYLRMDCWFQKQEPMRRISAIVWAARAVDGTLASLLKCRYHPAFLGYRYRDYSITAWQRK